MKKRIICLSIAMLIILSTILSACGSDTPEGVQDKAATSSAASTTVAEEDTEKIDPLGKYEEPIEITAVLGYNPPEDSKTPAGITPETQSWIKLCEDALNIKLKFKWTVPMDQFDQKFKLAVASSDLPDIMEVDAKTSNFQLFKENGVISDFGSIYEKYASPALKDAVEADGGKALNACKDDGKLFALPFYTDVNQFIQLLWIRTDWLKNLNMQPPKTIDDMEKLMEAFVSQDPDKNGKKDTYGLAINKNLFTWGFDLRGFFNGFGAYPNAYQFTSWLNKGDGNLVAADIQPEMKNALAKMQSMYKNGLIDKEFAIKDENKVSEDVVAGKIGMLYGEWWYPAWPLNTVMDKDPKAEWKCFELPSADGNATTYGTDKLSIAKYQVINKSCKNPEAAIKMMNLYLDLSEEKYGDLIKAEKGFVYNWIPQRPYYPMLNEWQYNEINKALKENKDTIENPKEKAVIDTLNDAKKFLSTGDKLAWGKYYSRVAEDGGWGLTRKIRDNGKIVYNEYYGPTTETMTEKGSSLQKMRDETFLKIIMGAVSIDEFDSFVANWKKLGGDDITNEVNEWFKKQK